MDQDNWSWSHDKIAEFEFDYDPKKGVEPIRLTDEGFEILVVFDDEPPPSPLTLWYKDNFQSKTFRNDETIPYAGSAKSWQKAAQTKQPAWCFAPDSTKLIMASNEICPPCVCRLICCFNDSEPGQGYFCCCYRSTS